MNKIDLLFIVDVTGSMGNFIREAQNKLKGILNDLTNKYELDLKVGLSAYRDHPTQDSSFVTATFKLDTVDETIKAIDKLYPSGGGDTPEAVLCGIIDGINDMAWRDDSRRIAFLVGDAPAHGMINGESCCQCNKTWGDAISVAQSKEVTLYSILLGNDTDAQDNFRTLAIFTGGLFIKSEDAIGAIFNTLKATLEDVSVKR
jgi:hypothetical protein